MLDHAQQERNRTTVKRNDNGYIKSHKHFKMDRLTKGTTQNAFEIPCALAQYIEVIVFPETCAPVNVFP